MPNDLKYGKVTLENRPDHSDDMPCFVFLAQDDLALRHIKNYASDVLAATGNQDAYDLIMQAIGKFEKWTFKKMPD